MGETGARFKPGDIVKLVLTGEKVMILEDLALAAGAVDGCDLYTIRSQDLREVQCIYPFELAPIAAEEGSDDRIEHCPRLAACKAWDKARRDDFEHMQKVWAIYDAEKAASSQL